MPLLLLGDELFKGQWLNAGIACHASHVSQLSSTKFLYDDQYADGVMWVEDLELFKETSKIHTHIPIALK